MGTDLSPLLFRTVVRVQCGKLTGRMPAGYLPDGTAEALQRFGGGAEVFCNSV